MSRIFIRFIAVCMCLAWVLTAGRMELVLAQKKKASEAQTGVEATEGDEDAPLAAARRRYGPNKASAEVGGQKIFILAGRPDIEKDPGYAKIDSIKNGELVEMTLGQAIKFSTPFDVQFGDLTVKKENVAPNYPGVYSLWLKKTASGWSIVFNEKPDIWGTMYKSEFDVGEIAVIYETLSEPVKRIKLGMDAENGKGSLSISWGKHRWSAPFTYET